MRRLLLCALVACKSKPAQPLPEAILGEWEVLCRTDRASTSTCASKEEFGLYKAFAPGGELVSGSHQNGVRETGHWTLAGDQLELSLGSPSFELSERWQVRIDDDHLVMWSDRRGFGAVYGRAGAAFTPAATETARGSITHQIGDATYTLAVPGEYRLGRDDNRRQMWEPTSGEGYRIRLSLSPRATEDGRATPCVDSHDELGARGTVGGVERDLDIGRSFCHGDAHLSCSVEHTRGYLEKSELAAAFAICDRLSVR